MELFEDWYMMYWTAKHFMELIKSFVQKLQNCVKSAELKKVVNEKHESIFGPQNLKSFGGEIENR